MSVPTRRLDPTLAREPVRFLVFSASLRQASLNSALARLAARTIEQHSGAVDLALMKDFDVPSYNQDVEDREGFPSGAAEFRRLIEANDAFVITSPEYNFSMPGLLKNAIDWVSRYRPQPFNARHGLLLSASRSMVGGTGACGHCASRSNTWGRGFFPICSHSRRHTRPLARMTISSGRS